MYAYITGTLAEKKPTHAVIEAAGVGYYLNIPASSYDKLPAVGKAAKLLTTYVAREDAHTLYGFASDGERQTFETLIGVSGVGPKLALAALSAMTPSELRDAVIADDVAMLTRIPGVGKRKAEKMVVDLRVKMAGLDGLEASGVASGDSAAAEARADARAALEGLGLARAEAEKRLRKILRENQGLQSAEEMIRLALRA